MVVRMAVDLVFLLSTGVAVQFYGTLQTPFAIDCGGYGYCVTSSASSDSSSTRLTLSTRATLLQNTLETVAPRTQLQQWARVSRARQLGS